VEHQHCPTTGATDHRPHPRTGVLTDRKAKGINAGSVDDHDIDPDTGRGRLSYRRAEELFTAASGGWTLHDLRHSALKHLAEQGMNAPMLMVKSGHQDIRTLARYARPSLDAVQRWQVEQEMTSRRG
jgi:integrase/recombinase XerC/integrase/recombinase XerD